MNKDKRNNIQLLGTLNNADESGIIANANQIYDANEDKSTQEVSKEHKERIETLETKESSMQTTLENITKTGEASAASNVTYNHNDSKLDATNVQQAVDELALGAVYDVSAKNPTAGVNNDGKWESLSALLSDTNLSTLIPTPVRKGGMNIKFVQSSDNKYVQYRLMADSWSIDTNDWAIVDEGVYVENPEFVYVKTDNEGKILWAIRTDGSIYYGAGVPPQIIDYINERIAELSLDEYEDIVAFLNDLEKGDKTLQDLLNEKVDKEEGKSLIDVEYANGVRYIENPEFVEVKVDHEDRILEAIMKDGTKLLPAGVKVIGTAEYDGATIKTVENPEFAGVWLDGGDKILFGVEQDGNFLFGCGVPKQVKEYIEQKIKELSLDEYESIVDFIGDYLNNTTLEELLSKKVDGEYVENPEFIEAKVDAEDKVLEGIQQDGTKVIGGDLRVLGNMEVSGVSYKVIENPEYLAAWVDAEDKVIFGLKTDGKTYVGDADFLNDIDNIKAFLQNITDKNIDWDALSSISVTDNPEYIDIKIDSENKILEGITADGVKHINIPVDNGAAIIENTDNPEYLEAKVDAEGKLIEGINKNGEKIFGVIPPQIKQYIDENMPVGGSGVQSIEYDEETGDMYATYDDEGGITDVNMEPNGDIYVEYEE